MLFQHKHSMITLMCRAAVQRGQHCWERHSNNNYIYIHYTIFIMIDSPNFVYTGKNGKQLQFYYSCVCVCINVLCLYVYMFVCMQACVCVFVCVYACMLVCVYWYTALHTGKCQSVRACVRLCVSVRAYVSPLDYNQCLSPPPKSFCLSSSGLIGQ